MRACSHTHEFEIAQPVDALFPLFTPEGERLWAPGWDYENVMGGTDLHEGYVFLTRSHDHAAAEAVWIVKRHDPARHHVEYYKVEPGEKVGTVSVTCTQRGAERTAVQVSYAYVALSERGERFVEGFTRDAYEAFIDEWRRLLSEYFAQETQRT